MENEKVFEIQEALGNANDILSKFHECLRVNKRFPTEPQGAILRAFFNDHKKIIMGQCGRSAGKTFTICYITWRFALLNPGSEIYIICPQLKQGKKIYWTPKRLQNYGPQEFVHEHRESEVRTVFKNESSICVDGCENFDALRGIKPRLVIYDEFQHHSQDFDEEVMQPNLATGNVSLVVMGTPPKRHCYYVDFRQQVLDKIAAKNPKYYYAEFPTWANPTQDKAWIEEKKQDLIRLKKYKIFQREYEGKLIFDTESMVFQFLDRSKHVYDPGFIKELIKRDKRKLQWYAVFDPGTSSCFAVLFAVYNPFTAQLFILDEIYAKKRDETIAFKIWERADAIKKRWFEDLDEWTNIYDEAAAWFANEIRNDFNVGLIPTRKGENKKKEDEESGRAGESNLNRFMMEEDRFFVSSMCKNFLFEMENYILDENGRYPKDKDHLVDCFYYLQQYANFALNEEIDREERADLVRRARFSRQTFSDAIAEEARKRSLVAGLEPDYYDYDTAGDIWN